MVGREDLGMVPCGTPSQPHSGFERGDTSSNYQDAAAKQSAEEAHVVVTDARVPMGQDRWAATRTSGSIDWDRPDHDSSAKDPTWTLRLRSGFGEDRHHGVCQRQN